MFKTAAQLFRERKALPVGNCVSANYRITLARLLATPRRSVCLHVFVSTRHFAGTERPTGNRESALNTVNWLVFQQRSQKELKKNVANAEKSQ